MGYPRILFLIIFNAIIGENCYIRMIQNRKQKRLTEFCLKYSITPRKHQFTGLPWQMALRKSLLIPNFVAFQIQRASGADQAEGTKPWRTCSFSSNAQTPQFSSGNLLWELLVAFCYSNSASVS